MCYDVIGDDMLSINELAKYIDVDDIPQDWFNYYDEALKKFDVNWLNNREYLSVISYYQLEQEFLTVLKDVWNMVTSDINLNFLVYLWYYILYEAALNKREKWNTKPYYFKSHGNAWMPVISMLMGYRVHEDTMQNYDLKQKDLQKQIIRNVCTSDYRYYNFLGLRFSQMEWGSRFIRGQIVQIGELQYELKKEYLDEFDVIFIHIPRNAKITRENLDYSFQNKDKVFKYFNGSNVKDFVTHTWLLSPDLKDILSSSSRILLFQSYFDILEVDENTSDILKFVFGEIFEVTDYSQLKEDTALQKELKKKLENHEKLHICLGKLK